MISNINHISLTYQSNKETNNQSFLQYLNRGILEKYRRNQVMAKYLVEVFQCLEKEELVQSYEYRESWKAESMAEKCRKFYYPQEYFKTKVRKVED